MNRAHNCDVYKKCSGCQLTNLSFKDIGAQYENRNHATVMASVDKIQSLIESDKQIANTIRDITSNINSKNGTVTM